MHMLTQMLMKRCYKDVITVSRLAALLFLLLHWKCQVPDHF